MASSDKNAESIGIMDPAFFVGKNILLKWVNDTLDTSVQKVEEMATGAYYCQLLDMMYQDQHVVALSKVNFLAKYDYEYVKNWNVLQAVFTSQGISKYVDVGKLVKAKYQDNLEFFQWFKSFFDSKYSGDPSAYGPKGRRDAAIKAKGGKIPAPSSGIAKPATKVAKAPAKPVVVAKPIKPATTTPPSSGPKKTVTPTPTTTAKPAPKTTAKSPTKGDEKNEVDELNSKMTKLRATIEGLEKERNFYFGKLRTIEVLCQQDEQKDSETKGRVLQVLYSTDEEEKAPEATEAVEATEATDGAAAVEEPLLNSDDQGGAPENLLDTGVAEGDLLAAEEPTSF
jgi:RP/EB family microtubule-associated protein